MNMISTNDTTQAKESIKVDDLKSSLLSLYPTGIYEKLFEQIKKELVQTRIHNNCIESSDLKVSEFQIKNQEQQKEIISLQKQFNELKEVNTNLTAVVEQQKKQLKKQNSIKDELTGQLNAASLEDKEHRGIIEDLEKKLKETKEKLVKEKEISDRVTHELQSDRANRTSEIERQNRKVKEKQDQIEVKDIQIEALQIEIKKLERRVQHYTKYGVHEGAS